MPLHVHPAPGATRTANSNSYRTRYDPPANTRSRYPDHRAGRDPGSSGLPGSVSRGRNPNHAKRLTPTQSQLYTIQDESPDPYDTQLKRRTTLRQLDFQHANLVLELPVPSQIVPKGMDMSEEMIKMRYTAVTSHPDDFLRSEYTLRTHLHCRPTELFICMTMYNEDEVLFCRTIGAIIDNIANLCSKRNSRSWGFESWQKVVVCILADGRSKINKRTLQVLTLMGCYQEGVAQDSVAGEEVVAHIFECTSQVIVSEYGEVSQGPCPVQIIFCLKEKNKKKLNSHRWFFNAFCPLLQPNVCVLLDVGTRPTRDSMYELWKCFHRHPGVGGACGEICVDAGKSFSLLLTNPLVAAQNFEYKTSNILDKPLESVCGFISVLPGAFSAYRYQALLDGLDGNGPLTTYLKGEQLLQGGSSTDGGLFERNRYLAEDRVLSFEIVTKKREAWVLRYVKSAKATTDAPTSVPEFISQRRRWLNGALFAAINATMFFFRIWTSGHTLSRKVLLQVEFIYNAFQLLFTWTSLANYFLGFFFLISSATSTPENDAFGFLWQGAGKTVFEVFVKLYFAILFVILVCSLGNRPQGSKWLYMASMAMFALCSLVALWCTGFTTYQSTSYTWKGWRDYTQVTQMQTNKNFRGVVLSLLGTFGVFVVSAVVYLDPWHMVTSFIQYMLLLPSYINILMMYAMCNVHDVTWGTKGDNNAVKDLGSAKWVKDAFGKDVLELELPTSLEDVDRLWDASRTALAFKPPPKRQHRDLATRRADEDRNSRTNLVLAWVGTNIFLILIFTSNAFLNWVDDRIEETNGKSSNPFLAFLFYSMVTVSSIRFTGSMVYLLLGVLGL